MDFDTEDIEDLDINKEDYTEYNQENQNLDDDEVFKNTIKVDDLLSTLKSEHKTSKNMYFDEDYFVDIVLNRYLPSASTDSNGKLYYKDKKAEQEVLAMMLKIVEAVINKYGIWRFEKREVLRCEGLAECWRSLPTFDPSRKKKFFHFLSLVTKYHLINLTKRDKEMREAADVAIQPDLESQPYVKDNFFFEDMEITLFDIIDKHFNTPEKHDKYIDLASILMEYIRNNRMIIGRNDLFSTFREYGYKTSDYKKFIADIEPYKEQFYDLAS